MYEDPGTHMAGAEQGAAAAASAPAAGSASASASASAASARAPASVSAFAPQVAMLTQYPLVSWGCGNDTLQASAIKRR